MDTQEEPLSSQDSFFNENDVYHSLKEEEPQEDLLYALLVNHKRTKHIGKNNLKFETYLIN